MLRGFKTEINPTKEQKVQIHKTIGTCRFIYNFYIAHNQGLHEFGERFMTGRKFSVWLNNVYLPCHPEKSWIKDVSSKSVKKAMEDGCTAFTKYFKGKSGFPNFKKKGKSDPKMYFVKNNENDCLCERHRVKVPTLGWVKLKEKGYLPTSKDEYVIKSGTISIKAGRYYISVLVEVPDLPFEQLADEGKGIDLGLKDFATVSDGRIYPNINKSRAMRALEKRLRREQRRLSRKIEYVKKHPGCKARNLQKQRLKVQRLYQRIERIRTDYIRKVAAEIVKTKPSYVVIEDLNMSGMMKNKHLSKAIASQKWYAFRVQLTDLCNRLGIELRVVGRFYPSSKKCHCCGNIKKDLKLSDRWYHCEVCGYENDRDVNAPLNLRDAEKYKVI